MTIINLEAYISVTDTFIEKDLSINEEIDKLRFELLHVAVRPTGHYRGRIGFFAFMVWVTRRL